MMFSSRQHGMQHVNSRQRSSKTSTGQKSSELKINVTKRKEEVALNTSQKSISKPPFVNQMRGLSQIAELKNSSYVVFSAEEHILETGRL
ncbi:hypothetical protein EVAR_32182_1 [Eumeta japonica]|uniref:Uncharacterized protein n=1 Tax=Eumeta variegata TaxID=151549 RepID=A0A4C1VWI7_EUMVA|nr:hypothetical protein EVAR_32182_1 [Eumeta japonica]